MKDECANLQISEYNRRVLSNRIHGLSDRESVSPVVIRNVAIILTYSQCESTQRIYVKSAIYVHFNVILLHRSHFGIVLKTNSFLTKRVAAYRSQNQFPGSVL